MHIDWGLVLLSGVVSAIVAGAVGGVKMLFKKRGKPDA